MHVPLRRTDPRVIGRYRLLSRLGEGGMGSVYLASDPSERLVAIKVIRPEYAHEEEFRARFRSEVARAREVPPFCTAEVLDADPDDETPYLVVEYVDGPSLNEVIAENGPLAGGSLHGVAVGVAAALAAIHGAGVIHRDLKPRNVLFALGTPKVIDFGIARPLEPTSFHTSSEIVVGTLAYMAPERFDAENDRLLTPAVDVFSWGAVVAYAGTGRTPFGGDNPAVTAARILAGHPRLDGLPAYLSDLVAAALDKNPANRPTAPELLDGLLVPASGTLVGRPVLPPELRREAEAAQLSSVQHPATRPKHHAAERPPRPDRLFRRMAAITAVATVVAFATGVLLNREESRRVTIVASTSPSLTPAPKAAEPAISDPLLAEGTFPSSTSDTGACRYRRGLTVTATAGTYTACGPAPADVFPADQTIAVRATLGTAHSCAAIWFRVAGDDPRPASGYRVAVCPEEVTISSDPAGATIVATTEYDTSTGVSHRIVLIADERKVTVWVDGAPAVHGLLSTATQLSGRVAVGAAALPGGRAEVRLTDAQLRTGTSVG